MNRDSELQNKNPDFFENCLREIVNVLKDSMICKLYSLIDLTVILKA